MRRPWSVRKRRKITPFSSRRAPRTSRIAPSSSESSDSISCAASRTTSRARSADHRDTSGCTIATIESYHPEIPFGADGLTFDSKGNLYIGNFADGGVHRLTFDEEGNVTSNTIFAKTRFMRSADGIFCDTKTDQIYVADSIANAVQIVSLDGSVQTLAIDVRTTAPAAGWISRAKC